MQLGTKLKELTTAFGIQPCKRRERKAERSVSEGSST
jgi:hypothetical protein